MLYWEIRLPLYEKTLGMDSRHYSTIHFNAHNLYGMTEANSTTYALERVTGKRSFGNAILACAILSIDSCFHVLTFALIVLYLVQSLADPPSRATVEQQLIGW